MKTALARFAKHSFYKDISIFYFFHIRHLESINSNEQFVSLPLGIISSCHGSSNHYSSILLRLCFIREDAQ